MSKHYVITGGAGFIGSNLAHTLAAREPEADITVIDDFRSGDFKNLEGFKGDLITADLSRVDLTPWFDEVKVDVVFHLASVTDTTDHDQFRQCHDNIEGWRNLLGTFNSKKTRIVYASSAATYGIASGINHVDQLQKPANVYAFTKVQLENLARIWGRSNPKQAIIGLRFFNVFGPRETHKLKASSMILQLAQQMKAGKSPRIFTAGEQKRDFVYVQDIVDFMLAAAKADVTGGVYNAGSGIARTFNDIVSNLNRVLGTNLPPEYIENPYSFYQPHTEADLAETERALLTKLAFTLEAGIDDYAASGWLK